MSVEEVLSAFRRDALHPFLGAAFTAVGIVSAAFAVLRRQRDPLLIFFALFAGLYGLRLWISSPVLAMTVPNSALYPRVRAGLNYIILIFAFLFFISLGPSSTFRVRATGFDFRGVPSLGEVAFGEAIGRLFSCQ